MKITLPRILIGMVLLWNIQCAMLFLIWPERFANSFELIGAPGAAAIRGFGVLFLMWNVPYGVALWNPIRHRLSLYQALVMQIIGLVGETWILLALPEAHAITRVSILRFVVFDGLGGIALCVAVFLIRQFPVDNNS